MIKNTTEQGLKAAPRSPQGTGQDPESPLHTGQPLVSRWWRRLQTILHPQAKTVMGMLSKWDSLTSQ